MVTAPSPVLSTPSNTASNNGLTITAYAGDGDVLLAFSLDKDRLGNLAGFAIECAPPTGQPYFLPNRLNFTQAITSDTTPQQRTWTSSYDAPFQKFHWVHFPAEIVAGEKGHHIFRYKVIARYCGASGLEDGPSAEVSVDLSSQDFDNFEFGFTRGYLTSQAYAAKFQNKDFRKEPKTLDYDTAPFEAQYEWLGYHARPMIFNLLKQCVSDPAMTVDLFAYDLDEPDILTMLEALGPRLRAFLDNAKLHTGTALEVQAHTRLVQSAGMSNVKQGHFKRFAHDKIIIQKKDGQPVKVLTGSANFSVRGLYVQANNVMVFDNPGVAELYEKVFDEAFDDMSGFSSSPLATQWFPQHDSEFQSPGLPKFQVSFAPHRDASVSLDKVTEALKNAKSSILFAVMALGGGGDVLQTLGNLHLSGKVFSYGMTQSDAGFFVYKPGETGVLVPFAALDKHVPPPFDKEWRGGQGQVIHDKFIVIDFNDENPVVFTGSSNLAEGGEQSNGDNLLAIYDPVVARAFAIEAIRLVDHYQFRAAVTAAGDANPVMLTACGSQKDWWERDYDENDMHCTQRELFALGPAGAPMLPHGNGGDGGARAAARRGTRDSRLQGGAGPRPRNGNGHGSSARAKPQGRRKRAA
jgi:hypothetical protein